MAKAPSLKGESISSNMSSFQIYCTDILLLCSFTFFVGGNKNLIF